MKRRNANIVDIDLHWGFFHEYKQRLYFGDIGQVNKPNMNRCITLKGALD